MSRRLRLVIWMTGLITVIVIFSPSARYVIVDYFGLDGTYRNLATVFVAFIVCGIYRSVARPLWRA